MCQCIVIVKLTSTSRKEKQYFETPLAVLSLRASNRQNWW